MANSVEENSVESSGSPCFDGGWYENERMNKNKYMCECVCEWVCIYVRVRSKVEQDGGEWSYGWTSQEDGTFH